MRVLVTGHQGYLGTVMCEVLARAGHDIVGVDTGWFDRCLLGPAPAAPDGLRRDVRDLRSEDLVGFDAVVHLAALCNDALGDLKPALTYAINHSASVALARAARSAGVSRFLFASSCSVYGAAPTDHPLSESVGLAPITPYADSKVRVEQDLGELADERFVPVILRNATAFGYSPRFRSDIVLNDLVAVAYLTGKVRVTSDGTPWRPLVHVTDIAHAFLAALEAPADAVSDGPINVGDESGNVRIAEIAEVVQQVTGAAVEIIGECGGDPRTYRVGFDRLRERLPSFRVRFSVERGAAEIMSAFRRHGLSESSYRERFRRLPRVRALCDSGRLDADLRWPAPSSTDVVGEVPEPED